uniref:Ribonuclease P/MRP protein subunit POP5 n=1 Tax=Evadne anonyx TaxID=141404 RepID=A0A9N6ZFA6_9CRUS|nr:EOG090X0GYO [Evadne anonyx]
MVRFKNRYMTVEIVPQKGSTSVMESFQLKDYEVYQAVLNITEQIHGDFGAAAVKHGLEVKYCNEHTRVAVIRSRHGPHRLVGSSLPFLSKIGKKSVRIHSIYTGGTIVKCFKFLQKYHEKKLGEALRLCKNEAEKQKMTECISKIHFDPKLEKKTM